MLEVIEKISKTEILVGIIIGLFLWWAVAYSIRKFHTKKYHKIINRVSGIGTALLVLLVLILMHLPISNHIQTTPIQNYKEEQWEKMDGQKEGLSPIYFDELKNSLSTENGEVINLLKEYQAGEGIKIENDIISLIEDKNRGVPATLLEGQEVGLKTFSFKNDVIKLSLGDSDVTTGKINLSDYLDNTDEQVLKFDSATDKLEISGGNEINLSSLKQTGVIGSVFFAGVDGEKAEDNDNLFWDNANNRLGLGTNTPEVLLDVNGDMKLSGRFLDKDGEAGTNEQVLISTGTGTKWVDASTDPIPFIASINPPSVAINSTTTITLRGNNFTPTSAVAISGSNTINSVNILSPTEIEINITATATAGSYDITISNNGVLNTEWANNGVGLFVVSSENGVNQDTAGESCKKILDDGFSTGDGTYWINPDGGDTSNAFQVYCDMTTDGGGWTRIEYAADLPHQAQFSGADADRWLPSNFTLTLNDQQINDIRAVSTEGKQTYHGTCQGVLHYLYGTNNYTYAFGFRFHNGDETAYDQQTYPSTNITVPYDGCKINNATMESTDFNISDIRVPVINVHSRDNSYTEPFGSPLTQYPAWLR